MSNETTKPNQETPATGPEQAPQHEDSSPTATEANYAAEALGPEASDTAQDYNYASDALNDLPCDDEINHAAESLPQADLYDHSGVDATIANETDTPSAISPANLSGDESSSSTEGSLHREANGDDEKSDAEKHDESPDKSNAESLELSPEDDDSLGDSNQTGSEASEDTAGANQPEVASTADESSENNAQNASDKQTEESGQSFKERGGRVAEVTKQVVDAAKAFMQTAQPLVDGIRAGATETVRAAAMSAAILHGAGDVSHSQETRFEAVHEQQASAEELQTRSGTGAEDSRGELNETSAELNEQFDKLNDAHEIDEENRQEADRADNEGSEDRDNTNDDDGNPGEDNEPPEDNAVGRQKGRDKRKQSRR